MPKKGIQYRALRSRIALLGMTQEEVSEAAGYSAKLVSNRIVGRVTWKLDEVYDVCRVLGIDFGEIEDFFPPKGGTSKAVNLRK